MLKRKETIILICDVQERFRNAIYGFDNMTSNIVKLVKAAEVLGISTLTTEQNPKALGSTINEIAQLTKYPLHLGTFPKTKFSMMTPEVLAKLKENAMGDEDVDEDYRYYNNLILVGIESHVCVLQTALDNLNALPVHRKSVYVVADAISSCNPQEIPIALSRIQNAGGIITTSESLLFQLMGDASDPDFKAVSAIIKEHKATTAEALKVLVSQKQETEGQLGNYVVVPRL